MKYIDFLTSNRDKQDFIIKSIESLEKEMNLKININNLLGDIAYIKVKRKKKLFGSNDSSIIEKVRQAFSPSKKKIEILLVSK